MNKSQRAIVANTEGPLLVIAGPGSGKTFSLVLRSLNLLLLKKAEPRDLVICTFTEKAAFELRDRISAAARKVGYSGDLTELRVSTIHSLCHGLLAVHRHRTVLGNNFETLDELTQLLFIFGLSAFRVENEFMSRKALAAGRRNQPAASASRLSGRRSGPPSRELKATLTKSRKS